MPCSLKKFLSPNLSNTSDCHPILSKQCDKKKHLLQSGKNRGGSFVYQPHYLKHDRVIDQPST